MKIVYKIIISKEDVEIAIRLITTGFNTKKDYFDPIKSVLINQSNNKGILLSVNSEYVGVITLIHQNKYFNFNSKNIYNICNWYVKEGYRFLSVNLLSEMNRVFKKEIIVNYTPDEVSKKIFSKMGFKKMNKDTVSIFNLNLNFFRKPKYKLYDFENKNSKLINHKIHLNKKKYFILNLENHQNILEINYKIQTVHIQRFIKLKIIKIFNISNESEFIKNLNFLRTFFLLKHKCLYAKFDISYDNSKKFMFKKNVIYLVKNGGNSYISPIGSELSYIL